jgi:anti-anti-sigma factor
MGVEAWTRWNPRRVLMIEQAPQRERRRAVELLEFAEFTMTSGREGDVHAIALAGELDLAAARLVQDELERVEASDVLSIVVDLSGLTFMDSNGVRLLVHAHARSRADSDRLMLLRGSAGVQRVFELCGVDGLLPFAD